jgi:hypothetical protein
MADIHLLPAHSKPPAGFQKRACLNMLKIIGPWISEDPPQLSPAWAGQPGNEDADVVLLRQQWLTEQLTQQDAELKHTRNLS